MERPKILIAHQHPEVAAFLSCLFYEAGYETANVYREQDLLDAVHSESPSLLVVGALFVESVGIALAEFRRVVDSQNPPSIPVLILDMADLISPEKQKAMFVKDSVQKWIKPSNDVTEIFSAVTQLVGVPKEVNKARLTFEFSSKQIAKLMLVGAQFNFSGQVVLRNAQATKKLFFEKGHLVSACSSLSIDRIGNLMVAKKMISENQLNEALVSISESRKMIGQELVGRGWIERFVLTRSLIEQSELISLSLFEWDRFEVCFSQDQSERPPEVALDSHPFHLARLGVAQFLVDHPVQSILPDSGLFLIAEHESAVQPNANDFSEDERRLLYSIDGQTMFRNLLEHSPLDDQETESFLAAMILTGIIKPSLAPQKGAVRLLEIPPWKQQSVEDFTKAFFESDTVPQDPDEPPPIGTSELEQELRRVDYESENAPAPVLDPLELEAENLTDAQKRGYKHGSPVRYLLLVGTLLVLLVIGISFIGLHVSPSPNSTDPNATSGVEGDLKPLFTKAIDLYDAGRVQMEKGTKDSLLEAKKYFLLSIEIVPEYTQAQDALQVVNEKITKMQGENSEKN